MVRESEYRPYIVSADTEGLLKRWAESNGYQLPDSPFFMGMLKDLERTLSTCVGTEVVIVPEKNFDQDL